MLIIFKILFILFAFSAIIAVIRKKREGALGLSSVLWWIVFWIAAAYAVLWPGTTQMLAGYFGIGRGTEFVLYVSIALIFYLLFRMNVKIESINRDVTKVVRKNALEEIK